MSKQTYNCICCSYTTLIKIAFDKHLTSKKHIQKSEDANTNTTRTLPFECKFCSKRFKTNSGFWKHKQTRHKKSEIAYPDLVAEMRNEIRNEIRNEFVEIKNILAEQVKATLANPTTINNTNNNTTNNYITIQELKVYLNTECKDAKPIFDFIENMNMTVSEKCELELSNYNTAVTSIWKRNYLTLSKNERPLYCVPTAESECTVFAKGSKQFPICY